MKKKVMFLFPPGKVYVRPDGSPSARKHCSPPIGIAYLASNLLKHGYEVKVIDALVDGFDKEYYEEPFIIYGLNPKEIAEKVSKSRTEISNKLRLLKLPPIIKDSLRNNQITYGHARALIAIKKSTKMIAVFYKIINNKLSVRDTEKIIKEIVQ